MIPVRIGNQKTTINNKVRAIKQKFGKQKSLIEVN